MSSLSLKLPDCLDVQRLPQHIAVIMDGNGRWAKQRGLPRIAGHRQGVRVLKELLRTCKHWGIGGLTAYAFSTENWKRPFEEVEFLMRLFEKSLNNELAQMDAEGVRINFIGDLVPLPVSLRTAIDRAMNQTQHNQAIQFNVAINYGGRSEIIQACRQVAQQVADGKVKPADIDENILAKHLYTAHCVEPDLLIRTSGEMRLSNFLLWQLAYAEMHFTDVLFPDFNQTELQRALLDYQKRDRRFGGIKTIISA